MSPEGATDHRQVVEPDRAQPLRNSRPAKRSPEGATECNQAVQPRDAIAQADRTIQGRNGATDHRQAVEPDRVEPLHNSRPTKRSPDRCPHQASPERATDHRQAVEPDRAQPLYNSRPTKRSPDRCPHQASPDGATDHRQAVEPDREQPLYDSRPTKRSPEGATECNQTVQSRAAMGRQTTDRRWSPTGSNPCTTVAQPNEAPKGRRNVIRPYNPGPQWRRLTVQSRDAMGRRNAGRGATPRPTGRQNFHLKY